MDTEYFYLLGGGFLVCAGAVALGTVLAEVIVRRTQLTPDGTVSLDGVTPAAPVALADAAALDVDTYALARMVESEAGGLPEAGKIGVAFATITHASNAGKTVASLLLRSTGAGNGYFGQQAQGRYAATSKDPSAAAIDAASKATGGVIDDPTGGADQWDSPWSYRDHPTETAQEQADRVAQARTDAGKAMVLVEGVPEHKLRFWRAG
jgi:hypothetical protein